jgi:hypothetical protein
LLFSVALIVMLIVMGGMAFDLAYQMAADNELQRSMDAAALAGAGNLGFDDTVFPTARAAAQSYAAQNGYHDPSAGVINLNLNSANNPAGDIVLGIWNPANPAGVGTGLRFEPSLDGTRVNSVLCQYQTTVPTSFLRLLGFNVLPVRAHAIAIANPPALPPPDACVFPVALNSCAFGQDTSQGCGVPLSFITSSGKGDDGFCLVPPCTNSAAWIRIDGSSETPNAGYLRDVIQQVGSGNCQTSNIQAGDPVPTNNGMIQSVFDTVEPIFVTQYTNSVEHTVLKADGSIAYKGKGWKVYVPVIETQCPLPGPISGTHTLVGWTTFVMTQVVNHGECAVSNPADAFSTGFCSQLAGGQISNSGSVRGLFGYYACEKSEQNPNPVPVPRSALATRLKLVD